MMKTVTTSDDCMACRECCHFRADTLYFAPLWTDDELRDLGAADRGRAAFRPHGASGRVFQIQLKQSTLLPRVWVCPFLDETSGTCDVYGRHPFDCRIWPFLLTRDADGGVVRLTYVPDPDCRGLARVCTGCGAELSEYARYLDAYLRRPETLAMLRDHPELIWPTQPRTVYLADMSDVLT